MASIPTDGDDGKAGTSSTGPLWQECPRAQHWMLRERRFGGCRCNIQALWRCWIGPHVRAWWAGPGTRTTQHTLLYMRNAGEPTDVSAMCVRASPHISYRRPICRCSAPCRRQAAPALVWPSGISKLPILADRGLPGGRRLVATHATRWGSGRTRWSRSIMRWTQICRQGIAKARQPLRFGAIILAFFLLTGNQFGFMHVFSVH